MKTAQTLRSTFSTRLIHHNFPKRVEWVSELATDTDKSLWFTSQWNDSSNSEVANKGKPELNPGLKRRPQLLTGGNDLEPSDVIHHCDYSFRASSRLSATIKTESDSFCSIVPFLPHNSIQSAHWCVLT